METLGRFKSTCSMLRSSAFQHWACSPRLQNMIHLNFIATIVILDVLHTGLCLVWTTFLEPGYTRGGILAAKVTFEQQEILDITRLQSEHVMSCLCILKVHFAFVKWNKDAERTQKDFDPFESYFIIPCIKTSKLRTRLKTNSRLNSR